MRLAVRVALALVLVVAPARAQDAPAEERWYVAVLNGTRVGTIHTRLEPAQVEGAAGWKYTTEMAFRMALEAGESQAKKSTELLVRADMSVVSSSDREEKNGEVRTSRTRYEATRVIQDQEFLGRKTTIEVPVDGPIDDDQEMYLHRAARDGRLVAGAKLTLRKVSIQHRRTHAETIVVEEVLERAGGAKAYKIVATDELQPGVEVRVVVDATGRIVEGKMGPFDIRAVPKEEAELASSSTVVVPTNTPVSLEVSEEHRDRLRSMVVEIELANDAPAAFVTDGYQEVVAREGRRHRLRLRANRPSATAGLVLPVADAGVAAYLRASEQYQSDAPEIATCSAEILKAEKAPAAAARLLGDWVYANLKKQSNAASLTAVETLRQRRGDCTEHASLYVGLGRAAGLPSRAMSGLLYTGKTFGMHAWAESWVGAWLPVDPAWGRVGTPPLYVSFGAEATAEGVKQGGALQVALMGGYAIRILEVDLDGQVFDATDPASTWKAPDEASKAVVERVRLRSGLSFDGELAAIDASGALVYRTAYGRTMVARAAIARVDYLDAPDAAGVAFRDPAAGVAVRFLGAPWRLDSAKAKSLGVFAFVATPAEDAIQLVRTDPFKGTLEAYCDAVKANIKEARAEGVEFERIEVGRGAAKAAGLLLRISAKVPGKELVLRYQVALWQWRGRSYRLHQWSSEADFAKYRPAFDATRATLELTGE